MNGIEQDSNMISVGWSGKDEEKKVEKNEEVETREDS